MTLSPWSIVAVYGLLFILLFYIGRHGCSDYVRGVAFLVLTVVVVYGWIGIFNPTIEAARVAVRYLFLFGGGVGLYLAAHYIMTRIWKH